MRCPLRFATCPERARALRARASLRRSIRSTSVAALVILGDDVRVAVGGFKIGVTETVLPHLGRYGESNYRNREVVPQKAASEVLSDMEIYRQSTDATIYSHVRRRDSSIQG